MRALWRLAIGTSLARAPGGAGLVLAGASVAKAQADESASTRIPPGTTKLVYAVYLDDYRSGSRVASMNQQFELLPDGNYSFRSEAQATGLLALIWRGSMVQLSRGSIDERGLHPVEFVDRRGNRKPRGATIDPTTRLATFLDGHQTTAPEGMQDRLSVLAQLGLLLAAGDDDRGSPRVGHIFEFPMLATSRVMPSQWRVEDAEELVFETGTIRATRIRRLIPPGDDSPSIVVWFDPARLPWPVRVRVAENDGQALDQVLQKIERGDSP